MSQVLNNEVDILNVANIDNDIRDSYTRAMIAGEEKETYCTRQGGYDVNEFFIWTDRQIYKTKATISQGDTFVLNTNIELAGTLSDQLYQLFSQSPESMRAVLSNIENGSTASRNFVKGEYILWTDGFLYEVSANTNIGTAWTVGTNITKKNNITDEITSVKSDLENEIATRAKLGAHQLLPYNLATIQAANTSGTWNGNVYTLTDGTNTITFTVNDDLSITVNGNSGASLRSFTLYESYDLCASFSEQLQLIGCPEGGDRTNGYFLQISDDSTTSFSDIGNGTDPFIMSQFSSSRSKAVRIYVRPNNSITNLTFKPVIKLAVDPSKELTPYAKTNRELTDDTSAKAVTVTNATGYSLTRNDSKKTDNLVSLTFIVNGTLGTSATKVAEIPSDCAVSGYVAVSATCSSDPTKSVSGYVYNNAVYLAANSAISSASNLMVNASYLL